MNISSRFLNVSLFTVVMFLFSTAYSEDKQQAQDKKAKVACIAFYNLENLFDTIHQDGVNDYEFLPNGGNAWDSKKYNNKLKNMSEVISGIGEPWVKGGPNVIGVSEIENRSVLEDLVRTSALKGSDYGIVHYDGPDRRGVDVALLYKKGSFKVLNSASIPFKRDSDPNFRSRDQLVVTGLLDDDEISIIVNHWPSRGAGPEFRNDAATVTRSIVDSLLRLNANAKIVVMGDLNDDPVDKSVVKYLNAGGKENQLKSGQLFNTTWKLFQDGVGSLAYRDAWNLFDQIIISQGLLKPANPDSYRFYKTFVYDKPFLKNKDGQYKGYPFRTFAGGAYAGGYSDHFPTYMYIIKDIK